MGLIKHPKVEQLQDHCIDAMKNNLGYTDSELFSRAQFNEEQVEMTGNSNYSYWRSTFRAFRKNKIAMFFLIMLIVMVVFTFIQPFLPNQYDPILASNDPVTGFPLKNKKPGPEHWLGTNSIGQDLWARIWSGTRTSLFIGIAVALIDAAVGILVGVLWGYVRKLDFLFTEIYNVLDNIPTTIVLILVSFVMRPGVWTIIFAQVITGWIGMARFVRNQVMIIRDRDYNVASRCLGTSTGRIITKNLLPYLVSVIMLRMALSIPGAIGSEVFITYIGLGLPASIPSLGNLINEGRKLMMSPSLRYQLIYPTIILSIVTVSFYMVGNSFSDAADPKNHI